MSRDELDHYRQPGVPELYTGPITAAQADWMRRQVARELALRGYPAPEPVEVQRGPLPRYARARQVPEPGRPNWTTVIVVAVAGFVIVVMASVIAVSCANTPPPPTVHKVFPNCRIGCF